MKKIFICLSMLFLVVACKDVKKEEDASKPLPFSFYGRMPSAVGKGISCTLDFRVNSSGDTTYVFFQTLLEGGSNKEDISISKEGISQSFVYAKEGVEQRYVKLKPNDGSSEVLFRVVSDSLWRMVRDDFNEFSEKDYYTFQRQY